MTQRIVSLEAENIKRIKAITIKPDGALVVVGGRNGAGKSSTLDAIEWAFGGKPNVPLPIRVGESKARIVAETEEYRVTRTFAAGGSQLKVESKDGRKLASPQALLDRLVGDLSFDPLAFTRMESKAQAEALRKLVGLDFADLDQQRAVLYEDRTHTNRDIKAIEARLIAAPNPQNVPKEVPSVEALMAELTSRQETTNANGRRRIGLQQMEADVKRQEARIEEICQQIRSLQEQAETLKADLQQRQEELAAETQAVAQLVDPNLDEVRSQITEVNRLKDLQRQAQEREVLSVELRDRQADAERLTAEIEAIDREKQQALGKAKFPVQGLGFSSIGGVTLNGIPFEQASSAEQLRVSVAMGLAMNPEFRVLLIRDGSLLDEDSLAAIAEMAAQHEAQVWLEKVGEGKEISVLIEDGQAVQLSSPPKVRKVEEK